MARIVTVAFAIFLIASHQQTCWAFIDVIKAAVGVISSVVGLYEYVKGINDNLFGEPQTVDKTLQMVEAMDASMQYELNDIKKFLKNLPNVIHFVNKMDELSDKIQLIEDDFKQAVKFKRDIKNNKTLPKIFYDNFVRDESLIRRNIKKIYRIILDRNTMYDLIQNFTTDSEVFESVCKTGMSHLQLLDRLLGVLKVSTTRYLITKTVINDLAGITYANATDTKSQLLSADEIMVREYKRAIKQFKYVMTDASTELWTCDSDICADGECFELKAFQKYLFREEMIYGMNCNDKCNAVTKIDKCNKEKDDFCNRVRLCPNELVGCKSFSFGNSSVPFVCLTDDPSASSRFRGIVPNTKLENFDCEKDKLIQLNGRKLTCMNLVGLSTSIGSMLPQATCLNPCAVCDCICPENEYFISLATAIANISSNKVVTGAKLTMINKTLHIQIEEGTLLGNGGIADDTVWKSINNTGQKQRVPISWNGIREIDLTKVVLPPDRVVTGLQFQKINNTRIRLAVISTKFNFRSGQMKNDQQENTADPARRELDLSDLDVPTKSKKPNVPDSKDDQFLKFTISSLEKDGGQTTIPFIDTKKLKTKPSIPLSGAGLIHRGQPNYGGFLALKLYTYNISSYIDDDMELM